MKNCTILIWLVTWLLPSAHAFTAQPAAPSQSKPNIVLILVDDMGYSDIGCFGGEIDTPSIDRLARNGLRFTRFYNAAKCFPSRASRILRMTSITPSSFSLSGLDPGSEVAAAAKNSFQQSNKTFV